MKPGKLHIDRESKIRGKIHSESTDTVLENEGGSVTVEWGCGFTANLGDYNNAKVFMKVTRSGHSVKELAARIRKEVIAHLKVDIKDVSEMVGQGLNIE